MQRRPNRIRRRVYRSADQPIRIAQGNQQSPEIEWISRQGAGFVFRHPFF